MPINASNNRYSGDALYISWRGTAVQADYRSFSPDESMDTADVTAGADVDRSHVPTLRSVSFSLELMQTVGSAGSAIRAQFATGLQGTLIYGPEGTAAGKPKYSCLATVTAYSVDHTYDDAVTMSVTLERNGAWIANFEHLGSVFP